MDTGRHVRESNKRLRLVVVAAVTLFCSLALALAVTLLILLRTKGVINKGKAIGAVAADHPECSTVGRDILAGNGSAVDAAIATLLCCGVRQPHSMGIGGGVFLVVYNKIDNTVETFDGREVAPLAATNNVYKKASFTFGPLSVGVPGEMKAYWQAHQKYGRLQWKELFQPAIRMAEEGHQLSYSTARAITVLRENFGFDIASNFSELCKMFCKEGTEKMMKREGDIIRMPVLATTLRGLAEHGPSFLYNQSSTHAQAFAGDLLDLGTLVTMDDLQEYNVVKDKPVSVSLGNLTLYTLTAPSGGPVLALILKILSEMEISAADLESPTTEAALWHNVVESFKFAYADRMMLSDPNFDEISRTLQKMTSSQYAKLLHDSINSLRTFNSSHYTNLTGTILPEEGTTHVSIIGQDGDAVSATSSINYYFGSMLVSPSTGIILNNQMADFSPFNNQDGLNRIQPRKRPLSSMAPAIVVDENGYPRLVLGSSGGKRIITVNAQVIARILWLKQSLKDAINAKRLHHQLFPNVLVYEHGYPSNLRSILSSYGHVLKEKPGYMAVVQAVARNPHTGDVTAFSDPRKHSTASLYRQRD